MTEKYEHSPDLEAQHMDGAPLNRTNTAITLSNEQYERLFFQPSAPRVGDAAKRFGKINNSIATTYHDLTSHSSQPEFARPTWFPHPIHPDRPLAMPVPRRRSSVHPHRSHCRLLLLRMYCYDHRRSCGVRSRKQYVGLTPFGDPSSNDTDKSYSIPLRRVYYLWIPLGFSRVQPGSHPRNHVCIRDRGRRDWCGLSIFAGLPQPHNVRTDIDGASNAGIADSQ
jgi:hypothetical protein